jgi:hypothetical protein
MTTFLLTANIAPIVTARLAGETVCTGKFFVMVRLPCRYINLSVQTGNTNEYHHASFLTAVSIS